MPTKNFTEATERVQEAIKETSDLFTKTTASLMDAYSKQLSTGYEFYKKLAESAQHDGKAQWSDLLKEGTASYQKAVNTTMDLSKEILEKTFSVFTEHEGSPLSKKSADAILNIFLKQAEQSRDFGTQFLNSLQKEDLFTADGFNKYVKRFNDMMHDSIKGSEATIKGLIAAYNDQAVYTQEASKKLLNKIQQQSDALAKMNAQFTEELVHTLNNMKAAGETGKRSKK
jgi:vacuolar-type H+-ATPase subunit H